MPSGHQPLSSVPNTTYRRRTLTTISNIPHALQDSIPDCAQHCLSAYITQEYSCSDDDASCLCDQYSSEGFTLGERAFLCLRLDCPDSTTMEQAPDVYNLCSGWRGAAQPTHSTLTLPPLSPSATESPSSTGSSSDHISPSTTFTTARPASVSAAATSSATTNTASTDSASTSATSTGSGSGSLTSAQAVGISIAAMGFVIIAIGMAYLVICLRRRKAKKHREEQQSHDFVGETNSRFSPLQHGYADPQEPLGGFHQPRVELSTEKRKTQWPGQHFQASQDHLYEKDNDQNPYMVYSTSPDSHRSNTSTRTTSQLLPDRPGSQPPAPPPPQSSRVYSRDYVYPQTPATIFEEERSPRHVNFQPGLPAHPAALKSHQPQYMQHYTRSPEHARQPSLSLEIPRQAPRSDSIEAVKFPTPPQPVAQSRLSVPSNAGSSKNSLLDYYASPDNNSSDDLYSSTPIDEETQVRKPAPTFIVVTKPTLPPRAVRTSTASDTSFESTDSDEPTPREEEDKRLTPVAESPIGAIRYPKIPRSSNQSVPRSPNARLSPQSPKHHFEPESQSTASQRRTEENRASPVFPDRPLVGRHNRSTSGSTLAAKRRGGHAADGLERGLHITDATYASHSRKNSRETSRPPKDTDRNRSQKQNSPSRAHSSTRPPPPTYPLKIVMKSSEENPLKSPLWEPKLTPSRKGDDLYLSVSAATPQRSHFQGVHGK